VTLRKSHGVAYPTTLPADELPDASGSGAAVMAARGKPFQKGNRAGVGRRPKLALLGVEVDAADPRYERALKRASRYRKRRCSELLHAHGFVSAGVAAMVASAALALCASRYLYEVAAQTGDPDTLKRASQLATDARQHELAAFEVCARESRARATAPAASPWLLEENKS
jgi:hypothetical protein